MADDTKLKRKQKSKNISSINKITITINCGEVMTAR